MPDKNTEVSLVKMVRSPLIYYVLFSSYPVGNFLSIPPETQFWPGLSASSALVLSRQVERQTYWKLLISFIIFFSLSLTLIRLLMTFFYNSPKCFKPSCLQGSYIITITLSYHSQGNQYNFIKWQRSPSELEKAARAARGACGHFLLVLRTF